MKKSFLVISPGNRHDTRNIGDFLLGDSFCRMLQHVAPDCTIVNKLFNDGVDDEMRSTRFDAIVSVAPRAEQDNATRFADIRKEIPLGKELPLHIFGANQKINAAALLLSKDPRIAANSVRLPVSKVSLYNNVRDRGDVLSCRDVLCQDVLELNGVEGSTVIGDPALFDSDLIGTPLRVPRCSPRVVVTLPHMNEYKGQTLSLLSGLIERFGSCNRLLSLHAIPRKSHENEIINFCREKSIEVVEVYAEGTHFPSYKDVDLHMGHRLHGHITFLRLRKPSLLFCEDGRGVGHALTVN